MVVVLTDRLPLPDQPHVDVLVFPIVENSATVVNERAEDVHAACSFQQTLSVCGRSLDTVQDIYRVEWSSWARHAALIDTDAIAGCVSS